MPTNEPRTTEAIREEIRVQRAGLDSELTALESEAKRSGRIAGSTLAAIGAVVILVRLGSRLRGR